MTTLMMVLFLFLLAFAGMALGLLMGRKSLKGGCGSGRTRIAVKPMRVTVPAAACRNDLLYCLKTFFLLHHFP